jgi:hypothetical protein
MPPSWQDTEHIQLRHKILLLQLLNNTPEKPSVARISEQAEHVHVHELSLQREKELTESFAFLAATTNDPKKVVAACVEERPTGLTVRLAVNHGGLETVKAGFERMARLLERVARAGKSADHIPRHGTDSVGTETTPILSSRTNSLSSTKPSN